MYFRCWNVNGTCDLMPFAQYFTDRLIRLVSIQKTASETTGLLQIYYGRRWVHLCSPLNTKEAKVACRELGLPTWVWRAHILTLESGTLKHCTGIMFYMHVLHLSYFHTKNTSHSVKKGVHWQCVDVKFKWNWNDAFV